MQIQLNTINEKSIKKTDEEEKEVFQHKYDDLRNAEENTTNHQLKRQYCNEANEIFENHLSDPAHEWRF